MTFLGSSGGAGDPVLERVGTVQRGPPTPRNPPQCINRERQRKRPFSGCFRVVGDLWHTDHFLWKDLDDSNEYEAACGGGAGL